ncbi:Fur family transcriptional regulator [Phytoactinopolyspora halotolerans]|uniref:Transcriptional repressor n=1 Tax=Phytoactinopolyspora halotolerans TaxID=1981512 RepID=A0A6L9SGS3_9ACTN|nr:transcriptional repressor [Phytoactinopolyspora halotolerans]NEE04379.1 transcriptional repressor [Phytoactinopolyspora halotolerans]
MTETTSRLRSTRQSAAVLRLLDEVDGFHSAQEFHAMLRERGMSVGLATVYRIMQRLVDAGEVSVVHGRGQESLYRRCGRERHYHLVCRLCHRAVEVDDAALDAWAATLAREHDFVEVDPTLEVLGLCRRCVAKEER